MSDRAESRGDARAAFETSSPGNHRTESGSSARVVLIAERDKNVRELQSHFLGRAGMVAEFVDDGQAALARARLAPPALLITEILLPRMDGLSLCRQLRADPVTSGVPVIVFSILAAAARAEEAGASAFLRKPIIESVFLAAIHRVIGAQAHEGPMETQ